MENAMWENSEFMVRAVTVPGYITLKQENWVYN